MEHVSSLASISLPNRGKKGQAIKQLTLQKYNETFP